MENGDAYTNGNCSPVVAQVSQSEFLGNRGMINRKEYIRLLEQALYGLGFRHAVTEGSWDRAVKLLGDLTFSGEVAHKKAKFLVLTEKYLEVCYWRTIGKSCS